MFEAGFVIGKFVMLLFSLGKVFVATVTAADSPMEVDGILSEELIALKSG